ncbi:hypothetical protein [Nonomuraea sp. NPDC050786]|uniref:hypothetical protein n=1 Tax=Nonomuraea sp. NPDC050786 TaxID=3154840 RepID=UPI0033EB7B9B
MPNTNTYLAKVTGNSERELVAAAAAAAREFFQDWETPLSHHPFTSTDNSGAALGGHRYRADITIFKAGAPAGQ